MQTTEGVIVLEQLKTVREFFKLPVPHSPQDLGEYLAEKSKAAQAVAQLEAMVVAQQPQAEPDAYCITTPDGDCISTDPRCMHQPQAEAVPWVNDDLGGMVEALWRVIDVHYNIKQPFHNPVYADACMAHRILVGYLPYMKYAAIAQKKGNQ